MMVRVFRVSHVSPQKFHPSGNYAENDFFYGNDSKKFGFISLVGVGRRNLLTCVTEME